MTDDEAVKAYLDMFVLDDDKPQKKSGKSVTCPIYQPDLVQSKSTAPDDDDDVDDDDNVVWLCDFKRLGK